MYGVVGVPSRLYFTPSSEKPLSGLRVSIKDNCHVAGAHTTVGSRSFTKLYGVQQQTSALVQKLIDLGAVVVGKTKMGAYAGSEVPPEKCIDYFPPWNPRGDGYQGPSGSSSGAGSSAATYHWLDFAIGTDSMSEPYLCTPVSV
jgi:Asp-tRNA(Asn)/Glu-tRNA(Gln) amidotransferase A subunit family amidase